MNRHTYPFAVLAIALALANPTSATSQTQNHAECIREGVLSAQLEKLNNETESRRLSGQTPETRTIDEQRRRYWLFWSSDSDIRQNVERWLRERNFKCLEQISAEIETTGATFVDGQSKLPSFLGGARDAVDSARGLTSDEIADLMREWLGLYPDSILAQVTWVRMLSAAAWHARGSGFADTVTPDGARAFSQLNREALARVNALTSRARDHLLGQYVTLRAAQESTIPRESFAKLSLDALRRFPNELGLPTYVAERLLPRWGGTTREFEQFARQVREVVGNDRGDLFYANLYTRIAGLRNLHNFPEAQLDIVESGLLKLADTLDEGHILTLQNFACRFRRDRVIWHAQRLWSKYAEQPNARAPANELDAMCREWVKSLPRA